MRRSSAPLRALVLLLAFSLLLIAGAYRFFANPQVPQGGSASFSATGTEAPASGTWDVLNPSGTPVANSGAANGWSVSLSGATFTVGAPATASVAANYKVRYGTALIVARSDAAKPQAQPGGVTPQPFGASSAPFDVIARVVGPPPAPTNLTAVGGTAKATLTWTASAGATGYNLKRATTAGGPYATVATNVASPYVNTGLTNGTKYYFVVTATGSGGESGNSSEASAVPIAVPTSVVATPGNGQVALSWSSAAGATGYKVKVGTTPGTYPTVVTSTGTSATVTGLTNGTAYYFVVTGTNTVGESDPSAQISATPSAPATPPAAPTSVSAVGGTAKATVTWTASPGATAYAVKWGTATGVYPNTVGSATSPTPIPGLANGTKVYAVVVASNAAGSSPNSTEASATPVAVPTNVVATSGNGQVALAWSAAAGATGYKVKYGTTSGGPYTGSSSPSGTSTTIIGLTNGTTYSFVVTGTNTVGESDPSAQVSARPVPPPPAAPTGLTATAVSSSRIDLAWRDNASNETGVRVERKQGATGTYAQIGTASANATSYQDTSGLSASTLYTYRVRATNAGGDSAYSNEASATTQAAPAGPANLGSIRTEPGRDYYVGVSGSTKAVTFRVSLTNAAQQATSVMVDTPSGRFAQGTVVIPAGTSSATFTAQVTNPSSEQVISVRARTGGFVQVTEIVVVPAGSTPAVVQGAYAQRNGGQVVVAWTAPTLNNFGFYSVERRVVATGAVTTLGTIDAPVFADLSAPTGTQYRVNAINFVDGSTVTSAWLDPMMGATAESVSLTNVPTGTVGGILSIPVALSGNFAESYLLVDGTSTVGALAPVRQGNTLVGFAAEIDTDALRSNGSHTLQLVARVDGVWAATTVYALSTSMGSAVETTTPDPIIEDQVGAYANMEFRISLAGWTSYTAVLTNEDDVTVRSWTGGTDTVGAAGFISLGWDGLDSTGATTDSGNYLLTFTAQTAGGTSVKKVVPISHLRGFPNFLALMSPVDDTFANGTRNPFDDNLTRVLARRMKKYLNTLRSYPGNEYYDGLIYVLTTPGKPVTPVLSRNFLRYLRTATTFYYYGHSTSPAGTPPALPSDFNRYFIQFGNLVLFPDAHWPGPEPFNGGCYAIDRCVADYGHAYNLVFLDSCLTGGGGTYNSSMNAEEAIGAVRDYWLFAWNANAYLGWNGLAGSNAYMDGTPSRWYNWRDRFWMRVLRDGDWISRAIGYANLAPGNINNPDPSYTFGATNSKLTFSGYDTTLP